MNDVLSPRHTEPEQFQREDRRILLSLGLLAFIVSLLINAYTLALPKLVIALLFGVAAVWVVYAIDMLIYFSDDLFSLNTRLMAKEVGLRCLFILPIELLIITAVFGLLQYISPTFNQSIILFLLVILPFFLLNLLLTPRIRKAVNSERHI